MQIESDLQKTVAVLGGCVSHTVQNPETVTVSWDLRQLLLSELQVKTEVKAIKMLEIRQCLHAKVHRARQVPGLRIHEDRLGIELNKARCPQFALRHKEDKQFIVPEKILFHCVSNLSGARFI